ncbi:hypothetical protein Ancab_013769 [Ancistrocladus abbreviatus]
MDASNSQLFSFEDYLKRQSKRHSRKSLLVAAGIFVASGTAAYMQSRFSYKQPGSYSHCNGPGNLKEDSENDAAKFNVSKTKKQKKKNALRSLQVLTTILLSQMGRKDTQVLLGLVGIVISSF